MKKPYAILRIQKRKDRGSITRSNKHNHRIGPRPKNVDPDGAPPRLLAGCADCPAELANRTPDKRRRDAVLAVEFVLTASPEWFANATPEEYAAWVQKNTDWIQQELGANFVQAVLHEDEKTPHIHAYGSCLVDGKLNFAKLYGTPHKLVRLQDRYAMSMKRFGLKRGEKASKATHEEIEGMGKRIEQLEKGLEGVKAALGEVAGHVHSLAGIKALQGAAIHVAEGLGRPAAGSVDREGSRLREGADHATPPPPQKAAPRAPGLRC